MYALPHQAGAAGHAHLLGALVPSSASTFLRWPTLRLPAAAGCWGAARFAMPALGAPLPLAALFAAAFAFTSAPAPGPGCVALRRCHSPCPVQAHKHVVRLATATAPPPRDGPYCIATEKSAALASKATSMQYVLPVPACDWRLLLHYDSARSWQYAATCHHSPNNLLRLNASAAPSPITAVAAAFSVQPGQDARSCGHWSRTVGVRCALQQHCVTCGGKQNTEERRRTWTPAGWRWP